jgi:hypothetical protein
VATKFNKVKQMSDTTETIVAPFSVYHRAKLERLVREWFEYIEKWAVENQSAGEYGRPHGEALSAGQFQILVAADAYLRATRTPNNHDAIITRAILELAERSAAASDYNGETIFSMRVELTEVEALRRIVAGETE